MCTTNRIATSASLGCQDRGSTVCPCSTVMHYRPTTFRRKFTYLGSDYWKFAERRLEVVWVETRAVQKFNAEMMNADLKEFRQ